MVSVIDKHLAKRVRRVRKRAGMTPDKAARMSGLELRVYNATENGDRRFRSHELLKLTKALNVSISDLYRDLPTPN